MRRAILIICLAVLCAGPLAAQTPPREEVQADISTREIYIKTDFSGIEILIFGSVESSQPGQPGDGPYDVIVVVRGPVEPVVVRQKQRVLGIWVNGPGKLFAAAPGFYAVLSSRPLRAITADQTLKDLHVGLKNLDLGRSPATLPQDEAALIRLRADEGLFQEHDDGVTFIGRSLFRATVDLPANVPIGRYTADVYLFRNGDLLSKKQSTIEVTKVGFERAIYRLAFERPFLYGLLAVALAVLTGLAGWFVFRRD